MAGEMNLSLLSRGIGEIKKNGHEKIEVKLEPQDYYNWSNESDAGKRVWRLPPLPVAAVGPSLRQRDGGPSFDEATYRFAYIPKTFTTRKGALLLFSEDLAVKNMRKKRRRRRRLAHSADSVTFRTVDDLAKGILTYGGSAIEEASVAGDAAVSGGAASTRIYLGFIHSRGRKFYERQIKPGFSARRYLGSWSKLWDYSLLCRISEKGLLKQAMQTVTESGYAVKNDMDLSGIPMPYRILRQWLSSPRAMDEYAFYRAGSIPIDGDTAPPASAVKDVDRPAPMDTSSTGSAPGRLKVAAIVDLGGTVEINYSQLDMQAKEAVLTELLVKSAITQAIQKHMEYSEATAEGQDEAAAAARAMQFDLMDAVETLVTGESSSASGAGSVLRVARVELDADSVLPPAPRAQGSLRGSKVSRSKGDASSKSSSVSWGGGDSDRGGVNVTATNALPPITNALHRSAVVGRGSKTSSTSASVAGDAAYQPLPPIGQQRDAQASNNQEQESSPLTPPTSNLTVANSLPPPADESLSSEHQSKEDAEYNEWRKSSVDEEQLLADAAREAASPLHRPASGASSVSHPVAEGMNSLHDEASEAEDHALSYTSRFSSRRSAATSATHHSSEAGAAVTGRDAGGHHPQGDFDPSDLMVSWSYKPQPPAAEASKLASAAGGSGGPSSAGSVSAGLAQVETESATISHNELLVTTSPGALQLGVIMPRVSVAELSAATSDDELEASEQMVVDPLPSTDAAEDSGAIAAEPKESVSQHDAEDVAMDVTTDEVAESSRTPSALAATSAIDGEPEQTEPVSEQSILDQLTEQASRVARVVLSGNAAGVDLAADANLAAELMSEVISPAVLSRAQSISSYHSRLSAAESAISDHLRRNSGLESRSVQDAEVASGHHSSSRGASRILGISAASSAKASVAGEITTNEDEMARNIASSHLSKPASRASGGVLSTTRSASVPAAGEAVTTGQLPDSNATVHQPAAVAATGEESRPKVSTHVGDEIKAAAPQPLLVITNKESDSGKGSVKSKKSNKSRKSQSDGRNKSDKGEDGAAAEVKEDPFVVGKVKDDTELQKLYAPVEPPKSKPQKGPKSQKAPAEKKVTAAAKESAPAKKEAPPAAAAKGKKKAAAKKSTKKDGAKDPAASGSAAAASAVEPAAAQAAEPAQTQPASAASRVTSEEDEYVEENKPEEPEMEFIIHRDDDSEDAGESDSGGEGATAEADDSTAGSRPVKFDFRSLQSLQQSQDDADEDEAEEDGEEEEVLQNVSNKDARAAKQAAEKERRRQDVERRRREREEQLRREKEEAERRERVQQQLEEDRRRREEEKRLRKEQEEEEERRRDAEELEREQRRRDAEERERRREAEYQRHLADARRRAEEEEARRRELAAQKAREEAELRRLEEEMLSKMALEERLEYERLKREEEERRHAAEEEARLRREEESRLAMEAARLLAEEAARQQEALRQRLLFQRGLNLEASGLDHAHDITRAFVFSYYELLQWLGVNVPNLADLVQWARSNAGDDT